MLNLRPPRHTPTLRIRAEDPHLFGSDSGHLVGGLSGDALRDRVGRPEDAKYVLSFRLKRSRRQNWSSR
jgi:hypothetical protein